MNRTTVWVVAGMLAVPMALPAQAVPPATPAACVQDAGTWYSRAIKAAQDSARLPGAKAPDYAAVYAQRMARMKGCAAQFSVERTSGADLLALASLYSQVGLDSLATSAVNKRLGEPGLGEPDRAAAIATMIRALTKPDPLVIARAEPYMKQLDAMSDAVIMDKLAAHSNLNGEYRYLDVNDRIQQHSLAIISLGKKLKAAAPGDRSAAAVSPYTLLAAYTNLGEVYADLGHVDSTFRILDQATVDHPEIAAKDLDAYLTPERERYQLVGRPSMVLEAGHWLNAAADTRALDPRGKVTVIEFTAHWCIPCRNSYPAMADMAEKFGKQGVQFAFATQFYGYIGARRNLDPAAEFAGDQEYFVSEHGIRFPVAIADAPPPYQPWTPYVPNINDGSSSPPTLKDRTSSPSRPPAGWPT